MSVCVWQNQVNLLSVPRPLFVTNYAKIAAPSQIKWQVKPLQTLHTFHFPLSSPPSPATSTTFCPNTNGMRKKLISKNYFKATLPYVVVFYYWPQYAVIVSMAKRDREKERHRGRGRRREQQQEYEVETHRDIHIYTWYIRHKGNRNLLNKKQFKEFLTNQKKKNRKK